MSVIDCDWIGSALKQRAEVQTLAQCASGRLSSIAMLAFDVVCSGCAQPCLRTVILALVVERSVRPSPRLDRFVPLFRTMVHADIVIGLACPCV